MTELRIKGGGFVHTRFVHTRQTKSGFPAFLDFKKNWAVRNQPRFLKFHLLSFSIWIFIIRSKFFWDAVRGSDIAMTSTCYSVPLLFLLWNPQEALMRKDQMCYYTSWIQFQSNKIGKNLCLWRWSMHYSTMNLPWKQSKGYLDEQILSDLIYTSSRRAGLTPKDSCMSYPSQGDAFSARVNLYCQRYHLGLAYF